MKGKTVEKVVTKPQRVIRRISRGHQVTLPPRFLKKNDLHVGDAVEIFEEEGKITIQPITITNSQEKSRLIQTVQDLFAQIDSQTSEIQLKNEEDILKVINNEIEQSRKS